MKSVPLLSLVGVLIVLVLISIFSLQLCSGVSVIRSGGGGESLHPRLVGNHSSVNASHRHHRHHHHHHHHRVKRQLVAYHRLEAGDVLPVLANRRRGQKGGRRSPVGEDGTDGGLFRSAGVGYEHHHNNRCEESKCGYNIRHCPHGCVFNSFTCGGGSAYDTCCC